MIQTFNSQKYVIVLLVVIVIFASVLGYFVLAERSKQQGPLTWEKCIKISGSIIQQSYPRVCVTPDGHRAVEPLAEREERKLTPPAPFEDAVELCETENPLFNPTEECQKIIDEEYPDRECTFELGPIEWLPMGSCRDCIINCQ